MRLHQIQDSAQQNKMKRQPAEWEKILQTMYQTRG